MKFLSLLLVLLLGGFFQTTETISKKFLQEVDCITTLSSELPRSIRKFTISIVGKKNGEKLEYTDPFERYVEGAKQNGCTIPDEPLLILRSLDINSKVYIDIKYLSYESDTPFAMAFALKITD